MPLYICAHLRHLRFNWIVQKFRGGEVPVTGEASPTGFRSPDYPRNRKLHGGRGGGNREIGVPGGEPQGIAHGETKKLNRSPRLRDLCDLL